MLEQESESSSSSNYSVILGKCGKHSWLSPQMLFFQASSSPCLSTLLQISIFKEARLPLIPRDGITISLSQSQNMLLFCP